MLQQAGHATLVAPTAAQARAYLAGADPAGADPDLIVLNPALPDEDGLHLCASLRAESDVPIVISGASLERQTVVDALKLGADDVLHERCDPEEVLARVEAVLRRAQPRQASPRARDAALRAGALAIDQSRCRVTLRGEAVSVTPTEYRLLVALIRQPGRLVTREELDRLAWGARRPTREGRRIDVCVHRLRQRLGLLGDAAGVPWLTAVRGHGYRLVVPS
jgi:DNA-binding response OmpR family regulator